MNQSKDFTEKIASDNAAIDRIDKMNILQRCVHKLEFKRRTEREKAEKVNARKSFHSTNHIIRCRDFAGGKREQRENDLPEHRLLTKIVPTRDPYTAVLPQEHAVAPARSYGPCPQLWPSHRQ